MISSSNMALKICFFSFFCSNNCMYLQKQVLPRCPCIVVESMEKPVQTAVWPETPTAPGMEKTALPLHKPPKGLRTWILSNCTYLPCLLTAKEMRMFLNHLMWIQIHRTVKLHEVWLYFVLLHLGGAEGRMLNMVTLCVSAGATTLKVTKTNSHQQIVFRIKMRSVWCICIIGHSIWL